MYPSQLSSTFAIDEGEKSRIIGVEEIEGAMRGEEDEGGKPELLGSLTSTSDGLRT